MPLRPRTTPLAQSPRKVATVGEDEAAQAGAAKSIAAAEAGAASPDAGKVTVDSGKVAADGSEPKEEAGAGAGGASAALDIPFAPITLVFE